MTLAVGRGWFFERVDAPVARSVRIFHRAYAPLRPIDVDVTFPPEIWAAIVAKMGTVDEAVKREPVS